MRTRMVGPGRFVTAASATVVMAVSACAFANYTLTSEPDAFLRASIMVSEAQAPLLSDVQSWWTGVTVLSMLFGTTIWSFVKFGTD